MHYGVVEGFLALTRKCFGKDGASLHPNKEKENMGRTIRERKQQHKGDCCYRYPVRKEDNTYVEWGKSARTSLKEIKGLPSPFSPFIYSVNFSACRKHLVDSSAPCSPWFIPSRVYSTDVYRATFPCLLSWRVRWGMLLLPRCGQSRACLTTSGAVWVQAGGSGRLGGWTKMRQLMLLLPQPSSLPFGGCCHPWGSDV